MGLLSILIAVLWLELRLDGVHYPSETLVLSSILYSSMPTCSVIHTQIVWVPSSNMNYLALKLFKVSSTFSEGVLSSVQGTRTNSFSSISLLAFISHSNGTSKAIPSLTALRHFKHGSTVSVLLSAFKDYKIQYVYTSPPPVIFSPLFCFKNRSSYVATKIPVHIYFLRTSWGSPSSLLIHPAPGRALLKGFQIFEQVLLDVVLLKTQIHSIMSCMTTTTDVLPLSWTAFSLGIMHPKRMTSHLRLGLAVKVPLLPTGHEHSCFSCSFQDFKAGFLAS